MRLFSLLLIALFFHGCVRNPVTGNKELHFVSETQEIALGQANFLTMMQAQGGVFTADPALCEYVKNVGNKVAQTSSRPYLPYEFVIINDPVPNAWTLPGGKIAINRGLLLELQNEAELAAVLGHEIVHADARHGAKSIERGLLLQGGCVALGVLANNKRYGDILVGSSFVGATLIQQKHGRNHEFEADKYGTLYMAKAGYDPQASVHLQEMFLKLSKNQKTSWIEGLFASHPPSQERIDANIETVQELQTKGFSEGILGIDEYKAATQWLREKAPAYETYEKGKKQLAMKNYKAAIASANKALSLSSDEALFWNLKGTALLAERAFYDADTAFSKAIEHNSTYFDFYLNRAKAKNHLGNPQAAKRDLKKSLALLQTGEGHELMGRLLLASGQKQLALEHLHIASQADSPAGRRAKKLLATNSTPR